MPASIQVDDDEQGGVQPTQTDSTSQAPASGQATADTSSQQTTVASETESSVPASTGPSSSPTPDSQAQAQQPEFTDLLDYARAQGYDVSGFQDSRQAFTQLFQAYQQQQALAPYQPYVQQYVQHAPQFQQWLQQEQARQQQAQQPKPLWDPPASRDDVQRLMASYYERDPQTGAVKPRADCPLEVRQKVDQYQQYVADWNFKLQHDPMSALAPMIAAEAQKIVQQSLGQYSEQRQAEQMVQRNSDWLYQRDGQGNQLYTPQGQPVLSREGTLFANHLRDAESMGIRGAANQERYALRQVHADLLFERQQPAQQQQQRNQQFLNQNNRRPSVGAAVATAQGQTQSVAGMGIRDMLRRAFEAEGINDQTIQEDLAR